MTGESTLNLDFIGFKVELLSESEEILKRIEKDFSFFVSKKTSQVDLKIQLFWKDSDELAIPPLASSRQSHLCISYDVKHIRYVDYHGKLKCKFDFSKEEAFLYSKNTEKAHEVLYLLILSRAGKALDLKGYHRIHSFGVYYKETICLGVMPSKGGKSTLLKALLEDSEVQLISDDTPLIDRLGRVYSFPIRLGQESEFPESFPIINREENLYTLNREVWGMKYLLSVKGLKNKIFKNHQAKRKILLFGVRYSGERGSLVTISKSKACGKLFVSCIVGHGLPIVIEYFWENGAEDFIRKAKIALSRAFSCLCLLVTSDCYEIQLGSDLDYNKRLLKERLSTFS